MALDEIPFVFVGSRDTGADVDPMPIEDLVEVNHSHYMTSADYAHALHFCGLPTPYAFGKDVGIPQWEADPKNPAEKILVRILKIGSGTAWTGDDPQTQVGFLEFTGQGIQPLKTALDDCKNEMAVLGARLLEGQKKEAETAETLQIRQSGDTGVLASLAATASEGLTKVWYWLCYFRGQEAGAKAVTVNREFFDASIPPEMINAIVLAWQGGAIDQDSMLRKFKEGGLIAPDVDIEDVKSNLELNPGPGLATPPVSKEPPTPKDPANPANNPTPPTPAAK